MSESEELRSDFSSFTGQSFRQEKTKKKWGRVILASISSKEKESKDKRMKKRARKKESGVVLVVSQGDDISKRPKKTFVFKT